MFALAFAPDGRRIAALVGRSPQDELLVILSANDPHAGSRTIEVNPTGSRHVSALDVSWSPSGNDIMLGRKVIHLDGASACVLPDDLLRPFIFAKADLLAAWNSPVVLSETGRVVKDQRRPMHLFGFDTNCRRVSEMDLGNDLGYIYDASPERGTFLLYWQRQRAKDSMEWAIALADASSGAVLRKFPLLERARFADSGNAICGIGGEDWHRTIECIDAETGKRLAIKDGWRDPYIEAALRGKRILISEHTRKLDWIDAVWREGPLKRREIWDFASGRILASWRPKMQRILIGASSLSPYACAISRDGEFVLEGGSGAVTLYKIAP